MEELVKQLNLRLNWEMGEVYAFENDDLYVQFILPLFLIPVIINIIT